MSAAAEAAAPRFSDPKRLFSPIPIVLALMTLELLTILVLSGGRFSYILDDAYIHLAVSEELFRGGYGVNVGEPASPSSSILWPFLLVPFAAFEWHRHIPLILNGAFALGTAGTLACLMHLAFGRRSPASLRNGLVILLLLVGGVVPLVFTGMEHLLQIWLACLCLLGTLTARQHGRGPWWLWLALAAGPLVRYEFLALTLPLSVLLWMYGQRKQVAITLAILTALLAVFSLLLLSQQLPPLPSSIMAKASLTRGDMTLRDAVVALIRSILTLNILVTLTGLLLLVALLTPPLRGVALALASATVLHFTFGAHGAQFGRYEAYVVVPGLALVAMAGASSLHGVAQRKGVHVALLAAALVATPLWPFVVRALVYVPLAADNIASQQREMHRFATDFVQGPVAVNDLGWVSYRNDRYVLDLWGLGSEEARRNRQSAADGWAQRLLEKHGVSLMMIYDSWVGSEVPPGWVAIGQLELARRQITPAEPIVVFYARPDRAAELQEQARLFAAGLPPGARFRIRD